MTKVPMDTMVNGGARESAARSRTRVRILTGTAMLAAVAVVMMYLQFSVPFLPSFLRVDFSDLPALIAAFAYGPWQGAAVCLVKNIVLLTASNTGGIGELCNFLLGAVLTLTAGYVYRGGKTKMRAAIGATLGAMAMTGIGLLLNYCVIYPIYFQFLPEASVMAMYQAIAPGVTTLWQALICFNVPMTLCKGLICLGITLLIYKPLSPVLKGKR